MASLTALSGIRYFVVNQEGIFMPDLNSVNTYSCASLMSFMAGHSMVFGAPIRFGVSHIFSKRCHNLAFCGCYLYVSTFIIRHILPHY